MKSILKGLIATTALVGVFATQAAAADIDMPDTSCLYIRGDIGIGFSDVTAQPNTAEGVAVGAGIGCQFHDMFRADVTFDGVFGYDFNGGINGDSYGVLANGYFDLKLDTFFTPYIGAGIGWGEAEASLGGLSASDDGFAWAAMAGVGIDVMERTVLDIGYKYREIDLTGGTWGDHMVRAGLRYSF